MRAAGAETGRITGDRAAVAVAGAAAGNAARFESLTSTYCNGARAGEDAALCRGGDALHAADLKAGNLFDRRTFVNESELRTAVELSRNLAAPVVHDPPALLDWIGGRGGAGEDSGERVGGAAVGATLSGSVWNYACNQ